MRETEIHDWKWHFGRDIWIGLRAATIAAITFFFGIMFVSVCVGLMYMPLLIHAEGITAANIGTFLPYNKEVIMFSSTVVIAFLGLITFRSNLAGLLDRNTNVEVDWLHGNVKLTNRLDKLVKDREQELINDAPSGPPKTGDAVESAHKVAHEHEAEATRVLKLRNLLPSPTGLHHELYRELLQQSEPDLAVRALGVALEIAIKNMVRATSGIDSTKVNNPDQMLNELVRANVLKKTQAKMYKESLKAAKLAASEEAVPRELAESVLKSARLLRNDYVKWLLSLKRGPETGEIGNGIPVAAQVIEGATLLLDDQREKQGLTKNQ